LPGMDASCAAAGPDAAFSEPTLSPPLKVGLLSPVSTVVPNSPHSPPVVAADANWTTASTPVAAADKAPAVWSDTARLEGLQGDMASVQKKLEGCEERDLPAEERATLAGQVARLEAGLKALREEAEQWKATYLKSQEERTIAIDAFEARAESELHGAREREEQLASESAKLYLNWAQAEELLRRTQAEAHQHLFELEREREASHKAGEQRALLQERTRSLEEALAGTSARHAEDVLEASAKCSQAIQAAERRADMLEARRRDLEEALARASARHADELRVERARHSEALQAAEERRAQAARHAARLEDALAEAMARAQHAEELMQDGGRLCEAERRAALAEERVRRLEADLATASKAQAELAHEAAIFRSHGEHLERVSHQLRRDLEEERAHSPPRALSPRPLPPPRPSLTEPASPAGSRSHDEALRRPMGPEQLRRLTHSRQLRRDVLSARLDRTAPPQAPRSTRLRFEAPSGSLTDRTAATSRYNEQGRLVSYDALGRAV